MIQQKSQKKAMFGEKRTEMPPKLLKLSNHIFKEQYKPQKDYLQRKLNLNTLWENCRKPKRKIKFIVCPRKEIYYLQRGKDGQLTYQQKQKKPENNEMKYLSFKNKGENIFSDE